MADSSSVVYNDQAGVAASFFLEHDKGALRCFHGVQTGPYPFESSFCHDDADDRLAIAGAGDRAGFIGIGSAPRERRIANSPGKLVEDPTRRGCSGQLSSMVTRDAADRAVFIFPSSFLL